MVDVKKTATKAATKQAVKAETTPQPTTVKKEITLSPTRIADFKKCPFLYKLKYIDGISFPPGIDAFRGSVVHYILEHIFDLPTAERTFARAQQMKNEATAAISKEKDAYKESPEIALIVEEGEKQQEFFKEVDDLLDSYFKLEDPALYNPTGREVWMSCRLEALADATVKENGEAEGEKGPKIGGFIDRLEEKEGAGARIVDYKTGKKPAREEYEDGYIFQMLFYSLVYAKTHGGELPKQVKLMYLKSQEVTVKEPTKEALDAIEEEVRQVDKQIKATTMDGKWDAKPNKLCAWCSYKEMCPTYTV